MKSSQTILTLRGVTRRFGGLVAVNKLSIEVKEASIHGLIGPNGAGKSTAFDLISGLTSADAGEIIFRGEIVTHRAPESRVAAGICRTFQTPKLFDEMSVLDVVATGRHLHNALGLWGSMFSIARKRAEEARTISAAREFLTTVGLGAKADAPVADLSYGERRLVEIARALATEPKLLLLDEVTSGLNPVETASVGELLRELVRLGLTIMLVEHDMKFVMGLCDDITVMNYGSVIAQGSPGEIVQNPDVVAAYLGSPRDGQRSRRSLRADAPACP
ncbi:ABC transporter ATP-binding protein [Bradyrhizobium sp. DOA9]|uniref:ABC transporter ATP-binding protein n=1 Tax=Bradyrhizobium sp. DOA9 TaxID=1126627 RepID=UPI000469B6FE|nr:ABC transporter ATP-binding protein [Bradyrhizobium sp. DOA9]GAJ37554.1 high-affinity branched-chain amino acid transport ATP-binding protein BivG [Bradyrhizobium sp. DOA9]